MCQELLGCVEKWPVISKVARKIKMHKLGVFNIHEQDTFKVDTNSRVTAGLKSV